MKFSESWLRSWVNPDMSSEELAHLLTMAGLEVEALEPVALDFENVVVGEIFEIVRHPNADRLNVCKVNVGEAEPLTIVCGAPNVAFGLKVPCARIGAVLPGDFTIKQATVRGVESFGMLCSAKELGLADESGGLWLLPNEAPAGKSVREYMDLDDKLFTLKLTPNRSDCASVGGIARDVSALTGSILRAPPDQSKPVSLYEQLPIDVEDAEACPLYYGRLIRGVDTEVVTPTWMVRRLERSGLRSISSVVDITNYVMLELGQPLHAFDVGKLSGGITVRKARQDEQLTLLNGQEVTLDEDVLVIADKQRVLAMAGIMGGEDSSVDIDTHDIFLESAFFHPDAIVGRARRYGLATDSSFRFERGVDFAASRNALKRATQLLQEICGGRAGTISEVRGKLPARQPILMRRSRVARVLGITLEHNQIAALLKRLQLNFTVHGDDYRVTPPSYRFDLSIEPDLIEELARLHGYDNIPALPPQSPMTIVPASEHQRPLEQLRRTLVTRDYQEIVSYSFIEKQLESDFCGNDHPVALQNPIASNQSVMRSSLIGGLVEALRFNLNRKQTRVRLFETGTCFAGSDDGYPQRQVLSGLAYGAAQPEQWGCQNRAIDFYDVKADVEALFAPRQAHFVAAQHPALHPGRSAQIFCDGKPAGWIGELHPQWQQRYDLPQACAWFELELDVLIETAPPRMSEISKFMPARRDLAIVVDDTVPVQSLLDAMQQAAAPFVQEIALFDVYCGKGVEQGKKSLAFRVVLQDTRKTLTDSEIEQSIALLVQVLQEQGAQLRM